jgi:hypothetical protein
MEAIRVSDLMTWDELADRVLALEDENATLRERLARLVEAAKVCIPDEGQMITFDDLVQHIDGLRQAIAEAEEDK